MDNLLRNFLITFRQIEERYYGNYGNFWVLLPLVFLSGSSGSSSLRFPQTSSEQGNLTCLLLKFSKSERGETTPEY